MKPIQYTIRNVPEPLDRYLRKRAQLSGKSLNQTVVDELASNISAAHQATPIGNSLDWFIGGGMDAETSQALEEEDRIQKQLAARDY